MKFLAISDIHGEENENLYRYVKENDIDLVLVAGDITDFGPLEFVGQFMDNLFDCDCDVVAIPGNCDPSGICNSITESGALCLHNNIIAYGDAVIFGYGGSNPTPFDTPGEIQDNKIYGDVYELLAEYDYLANDKVPKVRILLTHAPPFNTDADLTDGGDHVGSQGIQKSIHEFKPEISICGHIHEAKSISKLGDNTIVANPGMLKDNGAILINIENGENYSVDIIDLSS